VETHEDEVPPDYLGIIGGRYWDARGQCRQINFRVQ